MISITTSIMHCWRKKHSKQTFHFLQHLSLEIKTFILCFWSFSFQNLRLSLNKLMIFAVNLGKVWLICFNFCYINRDVGEIKDIFTIFNFRSFGTISSRLKQYTLQFNLNQKENQEMSWWTSLNSNQWRKQPPTFNELCNYWEFIKKTFTDKSSQSCLIKSCNVSSERKIKSRTFYELEKKVKEIIEEK